MGADKYRLLVQQTLGWPTQNQLSDGRSRPISYGRLPQRLRRTEGQGRIVAEQQNSNFRGNFAERAGEVSNFGANLHKKDKLQMDVVTALWRTGCLKGSPIR